MLGTGQGVRAVGFIPLTHLLKKGFLEIEVVVKMFRRAKILFIVIAQNDAYSFW